MLCITLERGDLVSVYVYMVYGVWYLSWFSFVDFNTFNTQSIPYVDRSLEYPARGESRVDHDDMRD
jgi:hypothetical protein